MCSSDLPNANALRIAIHQLPNRSRLIDFGCIVPGGLEAGLLLARICMSDLAKVQLGPADRSVWDGPLVQVTTDDPRNACMASQYAGWKIASDSFFAMGSGPMRAKRGREAVLERLAIQDSSVCAVGVLECDGLPNSDVTEMVAKECGVHPESVVLCVAPTGSIAGVLQVVARSVETSLHKLFELGFDLHGIHSAHGTAPMAQIGRAHV